MHQVLVFVGDYSAHLPYFPLAGCLGESAVVFVDRRSTAIDRQRAVDAVVPLDDIADVKVVMTAPSTPDECLDGIHWWEPITRGGHTVCAACRYCSTTEDLRPLHAPIVQVPLEVGV